MFAFLKKLEKSKHRTPNTKNDPYLQTRSRLEEDPVWTTIRIRLLMIFIILISLLMISTIRIGVSVTSTRRIPLLMVSTSLFWRSSMSESLLSSRQDPHPASILSGGMHNCFTFCLMFFVMCLTSSEMRKRNKTLGYNKNISNSYRIC